MLPSRVPASVLPATYLAARRLLTPLRALLGLSQKTREEPRVLQPPTRAQAARCLQAQVAVDERGRRHLVHCAGSRHKRTVLLANLAVGVSDELGRRTLGVRAAAMLPLSSQGFARQCGVELADDVALEATGSATLSNSEVFRLLGG